MSDSKEGKAELFSALELDKDSVLCLPQTSPPVQAAGESPASPARSVAPLSLRNTSPVPVKGESTEQELAWQWARQFCEQTGLAGPVPWAQFVAGDGYWMLWSTGPYVSRKGNRGWAYNLFVGDPKAVKRVFGIAFRIDGQMVKNSDVDMLERYHPEVLDWAVRACEVGAEAGLPPPSKVPDRKTSRKIRRRERGELEPEEKKRRHERERYAKQKSAEREEFWKSAELVTESQAEFMLKVIQQMWEAKTPYSIYKQSGEERYAPLIFSKWFGLPETAIQAWLANMKMDEVLAEELACRKTKLRGLKLRGKKAEREGEGVSSSEGKAGGIKGNG
jgi:hypothetical protein